MTYLRPFLSTMMLCTTISNAALAENLLNTQMSVDLLTTQEQGSLAKTLTTSSIQRDEKIVTIDIVHSGGTMTFIDETPDDKVPSLSIVVVESSRFNTLANLAQDTATTPLEIFVALTPRGTPIPSRLQIDHEYRHSGAPRIIYL